MKTNEVGQIENRTFEEIKIGDSASLVRVLTLFDVETFAAVTGNANPAHLSATCAEKLFDGHKIFGHGAWVVSLISTLLGNKIPGPGTSYKGINASVLKSPEVGDSLEVVITVKSKSKENHLVTFDCRITNQKHEIILTGEVYVEAPTTKITGPGIKLPEVSIRRDHDFFKNIIAKCDDLEPIRMAVCHPCDQTSLQGPIDAYKAGLIIPVLVGPKEEILKVAKTSNIDLSGVEIINVANDHESAAKAVELCRTNACEALMKGSLHTDTMMSAVVQRETGLRTSRKISHVYVMSVATYPRLILITDAAINIYPTLEDKATIVQNAIDLAYVLGIDKPKVAILSAVETVNPKIQSTLDAAALCKMADRGQITGGLLDGPLAFDNAVSMEAARIKKIVSPVAGQADILLAPDLEAGNMIAKQLDYLASAATAGIVLGARVPIVLTSRAESPKARMTSCAIAKLVAHDRRLRKNK